MDEVIAIINKTTKKWCPLDPLPISIVLQCLDNLSPIITTMLKQTGHFADSSKEAVVTPLLKKCGLEFAYNNLRPKSNLSYLSKSVETAVADQLKAHLENNNLSSDLKPSYRKYYSTETAFNT